MPVVRKDGEVGMTVREISHDEYLAGLQNEIQKDGLIEAVKKRLDEINNVTLALSYAECGLVQEKSAEIVDLLCVERPRLLTFDELKALSGTASTVYVERRAKTFYNETAFISVEKVYGENVIFHGQKSIFGHVKRDYGKVWRCWTSQPTDNQRREAKWIE